VSIACVGGSGGLRTAETDSRLGTDLAEGTSTEALEKLTGKEEL